MDSAVAGSRIISGERELALLDLVLNTARAATALGSIGVREGDAIALVLRNDFAFFEASWAAAVLGAYPVPVNWHFTAEEAGYIFRDCGAKAIVVHADLLPQVSADIPSGVPVFVVPTPLEIRDAYGIDPGDCPVPDRETAWSEWIDRFDPRPLQQIETPGTMLYTSGTTGRPKGVRRRRPTKEQDTATRQMSPTVLGMTGQVTAVITGPMYHAAPNGHAQSAASIGGTVVLQPRFDPEQLLLLIEKHRATHMAVVPTMFVRLLKLPDAVKRKYDLSSLKWVIHGGAPCPPEVKRQMIEWWGSVIYEYYGSTEVGVVSLCNSQEWLEHPGTVGKVIPGAIVRILDERGHELPPGTPGEVYSRLTYFADFTYHGDDQKRRDAERDGLIASGDVGFMDEDGYLHLCDRKQDMVISGGVNIFPAEIEAELLKFAGVMDCAVFGIPDEEFGESLCAYIQLKANATLDATQVRAFLRERIAGYKVPKVIEFRDELPREDTGKIFKRKLRDPYWERAGRRI
ncbi:MAG TPA: acyl-CoA synthetase [Candidatus Binatia bacterium]